MDSPNELHGSTDVPRIKRMIQSIPSMGEIMEPLRMAYDNNGLSDSYTNFLFTTLEHVTHHDVLLFGGTLVCNGLMGGHVVQQNPRTVDIMSRNCQFVLETRERARCMLSVLHRRDPERTRVWVLLLKLMNARTPELANSFDEKDYDNHTCVCVISDDEFMLIDPMGVNTSHRRMTVLVEQALYKAVGDIVGMNSTRMPTQTNGNTMSHRITGRHQMLQPNGTHTSPLWCAWCVCHFIWDSQFTLIEPDDMDKFVSMLHRQQLALMILIMKIQRIDADVV